MFGGNTTPPKFGQGGAECHCTRYPWWAHIGDGALMPKGERCAACPLDKRATWPEEKADETGT